MFDHSELEKMDVRIGFRRWYKEVKQVKLSDESEGLSQEDDD